VCACHRFHPFANEQDNQLETLSLLLLLTQTIFLGSVRVGTAASLLGCAHGVEPSVCSRASYPFSVGDNVAFGFLVLLPSLGMVSSSGPRSIGPLLTHTVCLPWCSAVQLSWMIYLRVMVATGRMQRPMTHWASKSALREVEEGPDSPKVRPFRVLAC
jgi:hypothetical protein